jgi:hypothetical protein
VAGEGGVKVTLIWQLAPAATEPPQLLVSVKVLLPVPVIAKEEIVSAPLPLLASSIVCGELVVPTAWLAKLRLLGETPTVGPTPVPVRGTDCWPPAALS